MVITCTFKDACFVIAALVCSVVFTSCGFALTNSSETESYQQEHKLIGPINPIFNYDSLKYFSDFKENDEIAKQQDQAIFNELQNYFQSRNFKALEEKAAVLRASQETLLEGYPKILDFYLCLANLKGYLPKTGSESFEQIMGEWVKEYPRSFTSRLVVVKYYLKWAYKFRGTNYWPETPQEKRDKFESYIAKAMGYLSDAKQLNAKTDPAFFVYLLQARANSNGERHLSFLEGVQRFPNFLYLYSEMATDRMPRWSGSSAELKMLPAHNGSILKI